jgi:hypothetical protein
MSPSRPQLIRAGTNPLFPRLRLLVPVEQLHPMADGLRSIQALH